MSVALTLLGNELSFEVQFALIAILFLLFDMKFYIFIHFAQAFRF